MVFLIVGAHAQTVTFNGQQTTLPASGLYQPLGVTVDNADDVYIADSPNNRVVKVPAGGGPQTTVGAGLNYPTGVAVDSAGDVFIGDEGNNRVVEVLAGGGGQTTLPITGLDAPNGVAVDATGNVYVADSPHNRVVELPAGGGAQITVGTGLKTPIDLAVDGSGDLYIADQGNNRVVEIAAAGGAQTTVATGLSYPTGVAVDRAGNIYVAEQLNSPVVEIPAGGGAQIAVPLTGLSDDVFSVGVDVSGNVYAVDTVNNRVVELSQSVSFGSVVVGSEAASNQQTLTYTFQSADTLTAINVLTQGAVNKDYTADASTTCATGHAYAAGATCTVVVDFSPEFPGLRSGAIALADSSATTITTYLRATSTGPQIAFGPLTETTVPTSAMNYPSSTAVDGSGNVYIVDSGNQDLLKVTPTGTETIVASGLNYPFAVAVDGAGNLYVTSQDTTPSGVTKIAPNGQQTTLTTSGTYRILGVAVDGTGDVYLADSDNNRIVKIAPNGQQTTVPATGLSSPFGIAVDAAGDIYIADSNNSRVIEITPGGTQTTVGTGLSYPDGVALDAAGDVFIADTGNNRVVKVPAGGGAQIVIAKGLNIPSGLAVEQSGHGYIADSANNRVLKLTSVPPSLLFATTDVGATSSDSPQSVTVSNIGNTDLTFAVPATGMNPSVSANFTYGNSSTCPQLDTTSSASTLHAGSDCSMLLSFAPTIGGSLTGTAVVADNSLNATTATTQTINLSGTATIATQTITFPQPATPEIYGATPFTLAATASSGLAVTYDVTGPATVNGSVLSFTGVGTVTVTANQAGNDSYAAANAVSRTIIVNPASLTVTATNASRTYGAGNPAFIGTYVGAVNGDVFTVSGTTTATIASPIGTYPITPSVAGSDLADYSVTYVNGTLTIRQAVLNVVASNASRAYGVPNPVFSGSITGMLNGDRFSETFSTTAAQNSSAGTYAIIPVATGANLTDYTEVVSRGTLTVSKAKSSLALSASASQITPGSSITFTATAKSSTTGVPTGHTVFFSDSMQLGTASLNAKGIASLTVTTLPTGSNTITASYSGDVNFIGSQSQLNSAVVVANPSFSMAINPGNLTIQRGHASIATVTLIPTLGYTGTVNFSCSQLPADSTCHFQPSSATLNGSGSPVRVVIAIQIGTPSLTRKNQVAWLYAAHPLRNLPVLPAMFFWLPGTERTLEDPARPKRNKKKKSRAIVWLIALVAMGAGVLGIAGCAGLAPSYPPTGQQTITVIALGSGGVNQSASVNLIIQ